MEAHDAANRASAAGRLLIRAADGYRDLLFRLVNFAGPRFGYALSASLARGLYRTLTPLREQAERNVHLADEWLGRVDRAQTGPLNVSRFAAASFLHRTWNLTDLMLARGRLDNRDGLRRFGGMLDPALHAELLDAQRVRRPVLLVTAYYGPFDLLPVLLGAQGIRMTVVYRPHVNPAFDRLRQHIRALAGCDMIPLGEALARIPAILDAGGTVGLVADHEAGARGIDTTFLGISTRVPSLVGLLAARHGADVVVAGVRRMRRRFRFEVVVTDVMKAVQFAAGPEAVGEITLRTVRAIEALIRVDPVQYNWFQTRWRSGSAGVSPANL